LVSAPIALNNPFLDKNMHTFFSTKITNVMNNSYRDKQTGFVLFVALIVLVAMSMAGIGMMRSVDASTQIAGNLASRQSAIHIQEAALEEAIKRIRLATQSGDASRTGLVPGYNSTYQAIDFANKQAWPNALSLGTDQDTGNTVTMVMDRLCDVDENCAITMGYETQALGGSRTGGGQIKPVSPHFRVIARVSNAKDMVTFVEGKFY
jgi:type IV pilus assembly protein PilX